MLRCTFFHTIKTPSKAVTAKLCVTLLLVTLTFCPGALAWVLATQLLIQLPMNSPSRSSRWHKCLASATQVGDPGGALGFCLHATPAPSRSSFLSLLETNQPGDPFAAYWVPACELKWALVWAPAPPLLTQLLSNEPGRAAAVGPNPAAPDTHVGDSDGTLGSWKWPVLALIIVGIWGTKQLTDLSLSFTLSLPFNTHTSKRRPKFSFKHHKYKSQFLFTLLVSKFVSCDSKSFLA